MTTNPDDHGSTNPDDHGSTQEGGITEERFETLVREGSECAEELLRRARQTSADPFPSEVVEHNPALRTEMGAVTAERDELQHALGEERKINRGLRIHLAKVEAERDIWRNSYQRSSERHAEHMVAMYEKIQRMTDQRAHIASLRAEVDTLRDDLEG